MSACVCVQAHGQEEGEQEEQLREEIQANGWC